MLLAPTVVPPITPWSRSIRVKGQRTGAEVTLFADDTRVGAATVVSPDAFVPLDPGVVLKAGQKVTASQALFGDTNGKTAKTSAPAVLNAPTVATLGKMFSRAPLTACATCVWLEGIVPGADVTVTPGGNPPITVTAEWTAIHVDIPKLANDEVVVVSQSHGAVIGPPVSLPPALALPDRATIDPPHVPEPLCVCAPAVELSEVRPGARITIDHEGDVSAFCLGSTTGTFWLGRPLKADDLVTAKQDFPECELRSSRDNRYETTAAAPPAPCFPYPVCGGDRDVEIGGLRTGAAIQFLIGKNSGTIVTGEVGEPPYRFNLPPLGNVSWLGVRQSFCFGGPWSETTWTKLVAVGSLDDPRIDEPLHECGAAVGVTGLTAGTRVYVVSSLWGDSIGDAMSIGDAFTDVTLKFPLVFGDTISLRLVRCGQLQPVAGDAHVKHARDELDPPLIFEPLDDACGAITVGRLAPGAFCDVERLDSPDPGKMGVLIASQAVTRSEYHVDVPPLPPGQFIRCRQHLCGRLSRPSIIAKTGDGLLEYVPSSAERIVTLTGPPGATARPPTYDTSSVGLIGTDLGVPVVHDGRLYFFFGDCQGNEDDDRVMEADADPFAWTVDPPEIPGGPQLTFNTGAGGKFQRLQVDGLPKLGNFEVPTGAFSYGGRLYVFVANEKVPEDGPDQRMNTSHLGVTKQPGGVYENLDLLFDVASTLPKSPPFPAGRWLVHVSPTVVRCADWPGLPVSSGDGLVMFGSELYHASNLFLAFCPLVYTTVSVPLGPGGPSTYADPPVPPPSTWLYFVQGEPATPDFPENWRPATITLPDGKVISALPEAGPTPLLPGAVLGEVSVTWHPRLRRWLAIYPSPDGIVIRSARAPFGPWSSTGTPAVIFNGMDAFYQATADNLEPGHQFVGLDHASEPRKTVVYAPYVIALWTKFDRSIRTATIYYNLSTEPPPYNVQLMKARLMFR
jgi:hypothetical protein